MKWILLDESKLTSSTTLPGTIIFICLVLLLVNSFLDKTQVDKAMEQIYLLLLQYTMDIPDFSFTIRCCECLPTHPKANKFYFVSLAGLGDLVTAVRRFRREDKSVQQDLFETLALFMQKNDSVRMIGIHYFRLLSNLEAGTAKSGIGMAFCRREDSSVSVYH